VVNLQAIPPNEGDLALSLLDPDTEVQMSGATLCLLLRSGEGETCLQTKNDPLWMLFSGLIRP